MIKQKERMYKYYENMMKNKCYTKGIKDSETKYTVLATRIENCFNPDDCYFAYIKDLPIGTCYVDSE